SSMEGPTTKFGNVCFGLMGSPVRCQTTRGLAAARAALDASAAGGRRDERGASGSRSTLITSFLGGGGLVDERGGLEGRCELGSTSGNTPIGAASWLEMRQSTRMHESGPMPAACSRSPSMAGRKCVLTQSRTNSSRAVNPSTPSLRPSNCTLENHWSKEAGERKRAFCNARCQGSIASDETLITTSSRTREVGHDSPRKGLLEPGSDERYGLGAPRVSS